MEQIFNIGLTTKILSDTIGLSAFNSADGRRFYNANKKKIQRMKDFDIKNMKPKDFENYQSYIKKVDEWAEWAKKQGYLSGFQQTALPDFYMTMFEAAYKWKNGSTPSWAIVQLFFDNDLCPPSDYFIEDPDIQKNGYKTFKTNLYMAFVLTNLFDSLVKNKILTNESRMMIRNGAKMYYRDFYIVRNEQNPDFSEKFEPEAKDNLMFRTLFCMLDGTLNRITTEEFLDIVYQKPEFPILLD